MECTEGLDLLLRDLSFLQMIDGRSLSDKNLVKMIGKYLLHVLAYKVQFTQDAHDNENDLVLVKLLNYSLKKVADFIESVAREVFGVLIKPC